MQKENNDRVMSKKTYPEIQNKTTTAAEPVVAYAVQGISRAPKESMTKEDVLANTMSVDAYFDELISLVHKDYVNL